MEPKSEQNAADGNVKIEKSMDDFDCPWCPYKTKWKNALNIHLLNIHTRERPFKCSHPKCPASFTTTSHLKRHEMVHTKERPFECPTCQKQFGQKYHLTEHHKTHTKERPFPCPLCPYEATLNGNLQRHIQSIHSANNRQFKCLHCGYAGKTKYQFSVHMRIHSSFLDQQNKVKTHACHLSHCPFKSIHASSLKTHLLTHSGQRSFKCAHQHCDYTASTLAALKKHIAHVHTRERKFRCKFCEYSTVTSGTLGLHMRTHTGEKPYKCPFKGCEFGASICSNLNRHQRTVHLGLRPFKCDQCPYAAADRSKLVRHARNHENDHVGTRDKIKKSYTTRGKIQKMKKKKN